MSTSLIVQSLGGLRIHKEGEVISFAEHKVSALFIYLLGTARPHPRETLAEMFWEDYSQQDASRNFSRMLTQLRKELHDFIIAPKGGNFVSVDTGSDIWFDFAEVEATFLATPDVLHPDDIKALQQAIELYRGSFLEGFYVGSDSFEHWSTIERERLDRRVKNALRTVANYHLSQGDHEAGIDITERLLNMDKLDEEAHRLYMILLTLSGQRPSALKHYRVCCEILDQEFGVQPSPQTREIYEHIRAGDSFAEFKVDPRPVSVSKKTAYTNVPNELTPFIGRKAELSELNKLLSNTHTRLITVVGPGGMGKTRLAIKAALENAQSYPGGVYFVSLSVASSFAQILNLIAEAIGLPLLPTKEKEPIDQIIDYIGDAQLLIILDNFEAALESADLVSELLSATPRLSIIATSREVLYLSGETLFPISGLDYPIKVRNHTNILDTDSGQLFLQSAERVNPNIELDDEDLWAIDRLCRQVAGMPLAIELAAGWCNLLKPTEILDELEQSIDILATGKVDVRERHRSVRAIFDASWARLSSNEQEVLLKLRVFRGGFTREAAQVVAGAGLRMLNILLSKSLIHRGVQSRYVIHDLMLHYLHEKLADSPLQLADIELSHCHYFADLLAAREEDIVGGNYDGVLGEFENIQHAWQVAITNRDFHAIDSMREGLWALFNAESWHRDGAKAFKFCLDILDPNHQDPLIVANYARCLALYGHFLGQSGDLESGYQYIKEASDILLKFEFYQLFTHTASLLKDLVSSQTQAVEALDMIDKGLKLTGDRELPRDVSIQISRKELLEWLGDRYSVTDAEDIELRSQKTNPPRREARADLQIGKEYERKGDYETARKKFEQSLVLYRQLDFKAGIANVLNALGRLACNNAEYDEARRFFSEALQIAQEIGTKPILMSSLVGIAHAAYYQGFIDEAILLIEFVLAQPAIRLDTRQNAATLLEGIADGNTQRATNQDATSLSLDEILLIVEQIV